MPDFHIHKEPLRNASNYKSIVNQFLNSKTAQNNAVQNQAQNTQNTQFAQNSQNAQQTSQNAYQTGAQNANANAQSAQNATMQGLQNIIQNALTPSNSQSANQASTNSQNILNTVAQANMTLAKMDNEQIQKYIQSMLNLPASIDKFIEQATNLKSSSSYQFLKLFVENMIDTRMLAELLNQNSKEATQKLLNIITNSLKSGSSDVAQLKEILTVLNSIHLSTSNSTNSLRELLLLYIPLNFQVFTKTPDIKGFDEDNSKALSENMLSIMFETYNFSNIMAALNEEENNLFLTIYANEDFIFDKFEKIVSTLAKESDIKIFIERKIIERKENEAHEQNFKVISNDFVSTNALLISHIIVRTIFRLDFDMNSSQDKSNSTL